MKSEKKGILFLLTGLSGSGKTTLGSMLVHHLNKYGIRHAYLLDGDSSRNFFDNDLSYSSDDRDAMTKRMAYASYVLIENNIDVVMANIARKKDIREFVKKKIPEYIEIFLDVDIGVLIEKDVKGVYQNNLCHKNPMVVGVDIPYEKPDTPDVVVYPYRESPEESLQRVTNYLIERGPIIGTKAETLSSLSKFLKRSIILPQIILSYSFFLKNKETVVDTVRKEIGNGPYIFRSSSSNEDSNFGSSAGLFSSVMDVESNITHFMRSAKIVRDSYFEKGVKNPDDEQILIQPMLSNVKRAGVICTRYKSIDSPYYVINFDDTGKTNTITNGGAGKVAYISRFIKREELDSWIPIIDSIKELEKLFPKFPLDIEFAILKTDEIIILQCRPLIISQPHIPLEESAAELIQELKLRFSRYNEPLPHIPGKYTILSDMADWNPSEIIGERPSSLSYSLYRELVTDKTWHEARASQGYFDLVQGNLMLSMAKKPYIDMRLSFNSFTPASLSPTLREKFVNYYLDELKKHKYYHDKIEFQIAFTCYDFSLEDRIKKCDHFFSDEILEFISCIKQLTNELILNYENAIIKDYESLDILDQHIDKISKIYDGKRQYWDYFNAAYLLIEHTRKFGALPFARLARLAFVGKSILFSLVEKGYITDESYNCFINSITTVASQFSSDLRNLQKDIISQDIFFRKYGHLRMNTYDICSPRYDQLSQEIWYITKKNQESSKKESNYESSELKRINEHLLQNGLSFDAKHLFNFIRSSIQAREDSKLRFTRALSDAIEYLNKGGDLLGLSREELQNCTLPVLLKLRNPEFGSSARSSLYLKQKIIEKSEERQVFDLIKLPQIITNPKDIELVLFEETKPNFISNKCVTAPVIFLNSFIKPSDIDLEGKIVIIENADPGYDWIFTQNIEGLITKYGGVASHMSIRCNEFNLPGAIGCGEILFSYIYNARMVRLDCNSEVIKVL